MMRSGAMRLLSASRPPMPTTWAKMARPMPLRPCMPASLTTPAQCRSFSFKTNYLATRAGRSVDVPREDQRVSSQSEYDALTPEVRKYMMRVYNTMLSGVATAAIGAGACLFTPLGAAVPYTAAAFAGFVPLLWLSFAPPRTYGAKLALFHAFTTIEGVALAPLVAVAAGSGVLGSALVLTGATFGGFSAAALMAPAGSAVRMQGPLMAGLLGLVGMSLVNFVWPMPIFHQISMYGGLVLFSLMVASDTGAMIERAKMGAHDPIQDGLSMFLNMVNIFVRMVHILRGDD